MTRGLRTCIVVVGLVVMTAGPAVAESSSWLFLSLLQEKKIVTYQRLPVSGRLVRLDEITTAAEPACLGVSPDRRTLFVSFRSTGQLASFRINPANGHLDRLSVVAGGADPAYLLPDRSGRFLLSAYYAANKVAVHAIDGNGRIAANPLQSIPTAEKAHGFVLDSRNRLAFVPHTGANRIYQFGFSPRTGRLTAADPPFLATADTDHPRHIVMHPSDRWVYTSNEAGDSIGVYQVDRSGTLRSIQKVSTLPVGADGDRNATARCEMTRDGRFVYVANRGHDSIACFSINQRTGRVTSLGHVPTEKTPRSFSIEARGRYLYAAGQGSGRIAAFRIRSDGMLVRFATYKAGPLAWWVLAVDTPLTK